MFRVFALPIVAFPIVLMCGTVHPQTAPGNSTIQVQTRLVVVPVTVRDKKDQIVPNLTRDDFVLTDNGKPQTLRYFDHDKDTPLTLGLLVDVSGSVRSELDDERQASVAFLSGMLQPSHDKAFIVQFGHSADLLADTTNSLPRLEAGLKKIDPDQDRPALHRDDSGSPDDSGDDRQGSGNGGGRRHGNSGGRQGGGTVLYDALFLSSDEVIAKEKTRKALILLTDGEDRGSKETLTEAIEAAQRADASVYAIYYKGEQPHYGNGGGGGRRGGFPGGGGGGWPGGGGGWPGGGRPGGGGNGRGEQREDGKKVLERIAEETGGRVFTVSKKETLDTIYKQIAEDLRSQYRLGFTPTDSSDGYHRIDLSTPKDKKLILQAREGYYAGAEKQ